ncbi:MAG: hypothetical protein LIQ30_00600 [Planctomycetes bacterium]|nr:hypothetical protein [Planctomycetota bacterium]MCD7898113.1 hypothetical protein [Planctomycetaceae bacterium]
MDQTGLKSTVEKRIKRIARLANQVNDFRDLRNNFHLTHEDYDKRVGNLLRAMAELSKSLDLNLFVAAENALVTADLNHTVRMVDSHDGPVDSVYMSMLALQSKTVKQLEELHVMLVLRGEDPETFHRYAAGTRARSKSGDFDNEGLPRDGIRRIMSSQHTRLKNKEANAELLSKSEREVIKIRRHNLTTAERLYTSMQRSSSAHAAYLEQMDDKQQNRE